MKTDSQTVTLLNDIAKLLMEHGDSLSTAHHRSGHIGGYSIDENSGQGQNIVELRAPGLHVTYGNDQHGLVKPDFKEGRPDDLPEILGNLRQAVQRHLSASRKAPGVPEPGM